jgi:Undecaprenyl-phosphate glucose phosphotransferase
MIKKNQKYFNGTHVLLDAVIIVISYILAWYINDSIRLPGMIGETGQIGRIAFETYLLTLIYIVPVFLILYYAFNLYSPKRVQGRRLEAANIIKANTVGLLSIMMYLFLVFEVDFSRFVIFFFYGINILLELIIRNIIRAALRRARSKGFNVKHILLVGYSRASEEYIDRIKQNPQWGYMVRGILDDEVERGTEYKGVKVIGRIDNLMVILPENRLDEIAITLGLDKYSKLEYIVALCEKSGVHTKFIPDYNNIIPTKPYTEDLLGLPIINIRHVPLTNGFNMWLKRVMDLIGVSIAIVLSSPIMLLACLLIKLTSKGPLIFTQERVGLHNKTFKMYKFRSMEVQNLNKEKVAWTIENDPRITPLGKFMRRTSIDELPQLFNILKGDMSLVGPRPERPFFVEKFREEVPRYMVKHQVRPGLTGWAQVNGYRGNTSIKKRIDHDLYYIENWTVGFDMKIIALTFVKGFVNKNAY